MSPPVAATSLLARSASNPLISTACTTMNNPMKKKIVIHSTSPKVCCTFLDCFSASWRQLSSSISTAAPAIAMVAGSSPSRSASTKPRITTASTAADCLSSAESRIAAPASMAITCARCSLVACMPRPHSRWTIRACTAWTTRITGAAKEAELLEAEPRRGGDVGGGGLADPRGGPADIGSEHLREQERKSRDAQLLRDRKRHRRHQQDGGDVVEEGRDHRGRELQEQQKASRVGPDPLCGPDREELKDAGTLRDRHQDHHAGEDADGIPIDALQRFGLIEPAHKHDCPGRDPG